VVQVHYGVGSNQPLAQGKGVRCEAESEGSRRQSPEPRDTNNIRHIRSDEFAKQNEVLLLPGDRSVYVAVTWDESKLSYRGRSHGRAKVFFSEARLTIAVRSRQKP
jgi:hypothetical protein